MKIKTGELSGAALDWAVAQVIGMKCRIYMCPVMDRPAIAATPPDSEIEDAWIPSIDWTQGGPLIERFRVGFSVYCEDFLPKTHFATVGYPFPAGGGNGNTHLIAAMRAIVASKLGDEVDVPEGLV